MNVYTSFESKGSWIYNYFVSPEIEQFSEWTNKESYEIKEVQNISSRVLTHWETKGIIPLIKSRSKFKTRRYSLIEILWLILVIKLRDFGLSLKQLQSVKESISNKKDLNVWFKGLPEEIRIRLSAGRYGKSTNHSLEYAIFEALINREPVYLVTNSKGKAEILQRNILSLVLNSDDLKDSLLININQILQAIFPKKDLGPKKMGRDVKMEQYVNLLGLLYNSDATKAELRMKNGEIKLLELTKEESIESDIHELLRKCDYQDISITLEKGKRQRIKRIEKIKL